MGNAHSPLLTAPLPRTVAQLCLQCLAHILTWAPLQTVVTSRLIHSLFQVIQITPHRGRNGL